jgi:hypothetical protein
MYAMSHSHERRSHGAIAVPGFSTQSFACAFLVSRERIPRFVAQECRLFFEEHALLFGRPF